MKRNRTFYHNITVFATLMWLLLLGACNKPVSQFVTNDGLIFGTYYHITYEHPKGEDIKEKIEQELSRLDMSLSTYKSESVLSKVNANRQVELDDLFINVFNKSLEISGFTEGAFDVTVAPLVNAWGFGFKKKEHVNQSLVDSIMAFVGYTKVSIENGKVIKEDNRTMLDFSAIAKGYSVDIIGELLAHEGCKNYMVEIGGEVVTRGVNKNGQFWRIGINEPNENEPMAPSKLQAIMSLNNKAVATSGNYRNFYVEDGKKFAHTISPYTGYPVNHSLLSATVLADDCMTADAFATALMVLGVEKAQNLISGLKQIEVFLIYSDENGENQVLMTKGFEKFVLVE